VPDELSVLLNKLLDRLRTEFGESGDVPKEFEGTGVYRLANYFVWLRALHPELRSYTVRYVPNYRTRLDDASGSRPLLPSGIVVATKSVPSLPLSTLWAQAEIVFAYVLAPLSEYYALEVARRSAAEAARVEQERLRAGLATGLYHQLGQDVHIVQMDASSVLTIADRFKEVAEKALSCHELVVVKRDLEAWPGRREDLRDGVQRAAQHRHFAFEALTGTKAHGATHGTTSNLASIVLDMLRVAYQYEFGSDGCPPSRQEIGFVQATSELEKAFYDKGIILTVCWDNLGQFEVEQLFYEFVLQELAVNAVRSVKSQQDNPQINVCIKDNSLRIENTVTKDQYDELRRRPPPSKPPGLTQSGWGIHGVWAYFKHVHNLDFGGILPEQKEGDSNQYWAVAEVPLVIIRRDGGEKNHG